MAEEVGIFGCCTETQARERTQGAWAPPCWWVGPVGPSSSSEQQGR